MNAAASTAGTAEHRLLLTGFPPIERSDARILILGSMPGAKSLQENQYYAYRQNLFWPLMGELFDASPDLPYAERVYRLIEQHVAVWDVLKHCERGGSLDSAICPASEVVNDFAEFFAMHTEIRAVFLNGRKAEALFRKHAVPSIGPQLDRVPLHVLPSTSPANAGISPAAKREAWNRVRDWL